MEEKARPERIRDHDSRNVTHAELVQRAVRWLRGTKRCKVILAERGMYGEFPDAIGWTSWGHCWVVECKSSRADFLRDYKKECRDGLFEMGEWHYYMVTPGVCEPRDVQRKWGLIEAGPHRTRTVKVAENERPDVPRQPSLAARVEMLLLISELSRYQMYGVTYPPLAPRTRKAR